MKKSKRLLVLVIVLAVICAATFAMTRYEEKQEQIQTSEAVILEIPADTVLTLSWEFEEASFSFYRDGQSWVYDEDTAFPVDATTIEGMLARFEDFSVTFIIQQVSDYSMYGLDEPEGTITVETEGATYTVSLGDYSVMDQQRYVDIGDGNVYLVSTDPMDYMLTELSDMILHDDTPSFETVVDIRFAGSEDSTIVRNENSADSYSADDVYFTEVNGKTVPLDTDSVNTLVNKIAILDLTDYVTYNATDEELAAYGLDEPELSVTVSYTWTDEEENIVSDSCVIHIGSNAEEQQAAEEAEAAGETPDSVTRYVRVGDSQIVYVLSESDHTVLTEVGYDDLRHGEVFWGDFDSVTRLDITLEEATHTLTCEAVDPDDENTEYAWFYGGYEVDTADLRSALAALTADSFTDEAATGKEELRLVVYMDNENVSQVELVLYRYDGSECLAVVDGETVSLVARSDVMALVEAVQTIVLN